MAGDAYCTDRPSDNYLASRGNTGYPSGAYPLGHCEGDCDNVEDRVEGLKCYKRSGSTPVPGCVGLGAQGKDYCIPE